MATDLKKLLKSLQHEVRAERAINGPYGRSGKVPDGLATKEAAWLRVGPGIARLIGLLDVALRKDERYEHLGGEGDAAVWEYVCKCALDRRTDHVKAFMDDHGRGSRAFVVDFAVGHLTVSGPEPVGDVLFLPLPDEATEGGKHLRLDPAAGCMARVTVTGTSSARATERGRERARHATSLLRVSLATLRVLRTEQLRFQLGQMYLIEERGGFQRRPDAVYGIDFGQPIAETFPTYLQLAIPYADGTEIQNRLALAVSWIDAAYLDASPVHRVGFLFTALEAMLGDNSEGLKAPSLVFYRTALGHVVRGNFPDPNQLYRLYESVRSHATHGETTPEVTEDDISFLNWSIQDTLVDLLTFCRERHLTTRAAVRRELLKDGVDQLTLDYLRANGPTEWWEQWSPAPKPQKTHGEAALAAEVAALQQELTDLKAELARLQPEQGETSGGTSATGETGKATPVQP